MSEDKVANNRLTLEFADGRKFVWDFDEPDDYIEITRDSDLRPLVGEIKYVMPSHIHRIKILIRKAHFRDDIGGSFIDLQESSSGVYYARGEQECPDSTT